MTEPYFFWLGQEADTAAVDLETYEQIAREVFEIDLTDPQADE